MNQFTPHARAVLLQAATQRLHDLTSIIVIGALLIVLFWTLVRAFLNAENRRYFHLRAQAESNHLRALCAPYAPQFKRIAPLPPSRRVAREISPMRETSPMTCTADAAGAGA